MLGVAYEIGRDKAYADSGIVKTAISDAGWRALIGAGVGALAGPPIGGEIAYWSAPEGSFREHLLARYMGEGIGLAGGALLGAGLGAAGPSILRAAKGAFGKLRKAVPKRWVPYHERIP